jgi:hypothetical protein
VRVRLAVPAVPRLRAGHVPLSVRFTKDWTCQGSGVVIFPENPRAAGCSRLANDVGRLANDVMDDGTPRSVLGRRGSGADLYSQAYLRSGLPPAMVCGHRAEESLRH